MLANMLSEERSVSGERSKSSNSFVDNSVAEEEEYGNATSPSPTASNRSNSRGSRLQRLKSKQSMTPSSPSTSPSTSPSISSASTSSPSSRRIGPRPPGPPPMMPHLENRRISVDQQEEVARAARVAEEQPHRQPSSTFLSVQAALQAPSTLNPLNDHREEVARAEQVAAEQKKQMEKEKQEQTAVGLPPPPPQAQPSNTFLSVQAALHAPSTLNPLNDQPSTPRSPPGPPGPPPRPRLQGALKGGTGGTGGSGERHGGMDVASSLSPNRRKARTRARTRGKSVSFSPVIAHDAVAEHEAREKEREAALNASLREAEEEGEKGGEEDEEEEEEEEEAGVPARLTVESLAENDTIEKESNAMKNRVRFQSTHLSRNDPLHPGNNAQRMASNERADSRASSMCSNGTDGDDTGSSTTTVDSQENDNNSDGEDGIGNGVATRGPPPALVLTTAPPPPSDKLDARPRGTSIHAQMGMVDLRIRGPAYGDDSGGGSGSGGGAVGGVSGDGGSGSAGGAGGERPTSPMFEEPLTRAHRAALGVGRRSVYRDPRLDTVDTAVSLNQKITRQISNTATTTQVRDIRARIMMTRDSCT